MLSHMATPDLASTESRARELLDRRITSIRSLVTARQRLAELQQQLADAERQDVGLYRAALRDGWTADELRELGIGEPAKRARVNRRRAAVKAAPADQGEASQ